MVISAAPPMGLPVLTTPGTGWSRLRTPMPAWCWQNTSYLGNRNLAHLEAMERTGSGLSTGPQCHRPKKGTGTVGNTNHHCHTGHRRSQSPFSRDAGYDGRVGWKQISGEATGAPLAQQRRTGDKQIIKPAPGKWDLQFCRHNSALCGSSRSGRLCVPCPDFSVRVTVERLRTERILLCRQHWQSLLPW